MSDEMLIDYLGLGTRLSRQCDDSDYMYMYKPYQRFAVQVHTITHMYDDWDQLKVPFPTTPHLCPVFCIYTNKI